LMLLLVNLPTLGVFLVSTIVNLVWMGVTGFARRAIILAACFGTMVTPFAVALNNHLFAAAATSLTLTIYLWVGRYQNSIWLADGEAGLDETREAAADHVVPQLGWYSVLAGVSAAFSVANELPSLAMFAMWGLLFALLSWRTVMPFAVGAALVAAAALGTNWLAHQSWRTPYAHRGAGTLVEVFRPEATLLDGSRSEDQAKDGEARFGLQGATGRLQRFLRRTQTLRDATEIRVRPLGGDRFEVDARFEASGDTSPRGIESDQQFHRLFLLRLDRDADQWQLRQWDDWYDYPGSYWRAETRPGVDRGEPSRLRYLFHTTFGMYGVFSLTPLWLLVPFGLVVGCQRGANPLRLLFAAITVVTLVVFTFYLARPEIDRNYGGVSICLRWLLWLAPLWLVGMTPVLRSLGNLRWMQWVFVVLLTASVFSVATSLDSPWQSPWIVRFASFLGWLDGFIAG